MSKISKEAILNLIHKQGFTLVDISKMRPAVAIRIQYMGRTKLRLLVDMLEEAGLSRNFQISLHEDLSLFGKLTRRERDALLEEAGIWEQHTPIDPPAYMPRVYSKDVEKAAEALLKRFLENIGQKNLDNLGAEVLKEAVEATARFNEEEALDEKIKTERPRLFYTDPLEAAWMAREFGIEIEITGEDWTWCRKKTKDANTILTDLEDYERFYVHPDSYDKLDPQKGDIIYNEECGEEGYYVVDTVQTVRSFFNEDDDYDDVDQPEAWRWEKCVIPEENLYGDSECAMMFVIKERNNTAFFMPEEEENDNDC